ncbi:NUDIX domain-containing protein [Fictibacillus fluitans]|uniref:NUDIX domain-containing protein n=1 Tax=Fictibacillus fluitans TaxID=3058422 RepID=A0ABT8HWJ3_9BACL|nr:NUDIX domain-containing protein [Fictibacillus sp. NE201]MDN4525147.1 NUDIX domain-containing protein [Fictibacillus sp. NE201]
MFIVNVEAAVYKEDKWLIIKRSLKEEHAGGLLAFVGGKVDPAGESANILEESVKRELFEEVGAMVKDELQYVLSTSFTLADGREVIDIIFLCELDDCTPYVKSPDEVEALYWLSEEEILNHPKTPVWLAESIKEAEAMRIQKQAIPAAE